MQILNIQSDGTKYLKCFANDNNCIFILTLSYRIKSTNILIYILYIHKSDFKFGPAVCIVDDSFFKFQLHYKFEKLSGCYINIYLFFLFIYNIVDTKIKNSIFKKYLLHS